VGARMKYLGLHLDGRWDFGEHFAQLAPKMGGAASIEAASQSRGSGRIGSPRSCYMWARSDR